MDEDVFDDDDDSFLSQINFDCEAHSDKNKNNEKNYENDRTNSTPNEENNQTPRLIRKRAFSDSPSNCDNSKILDARVNSSSSNYFKPTKTPKRLSKRRFPGPAGLLPTLKQSELKLLDKARLIASPALDGKVNEEKSVNLRSPGSGSQSTSTQDSQEDCLSHATRLLLERETRSTIINHLHQKTGAHQVLATLNIHWIRKNLKWLPAPAKVPFLLITLQEAPELHSSTRQFKIPCVRCIDTTGAIDAAIEYNFAVKFANDLKPGTCLALQNIGLIRIGKDDAVINITPRNMICMTSFVNEDEDPKEMEKLSDCPTVVQTVIDNVKLTRFSAFTPNTIWTAYEQLLEVKSLNQEKETEITYNDTPKTSKTSEYFASNRNIGSNSSLQRNVSAAGPSTGSIPSKSTMPVTSFEEEEDDPFFEELDLRLLDEVEAMMNSTT